MKGFVINGFVPVIFVYVKLLIVDDTGRNIAREV